MSPFSKPTKAPTERWIKNGKAAELLCVDVRTIKRWMKNPATQKALGAVRLGKQWRIPCPDVEWAWEAHTRRRLKEAGIPLKSNLEQELHRLSKENDRYSPESYRLWLAAYIKALDQGRVTQKVRENILLLWQTACEILDSQKSLKRYEMDVEKLKSYFPTELRKRGSSVKSVMHHWPKKKHFQILRSAYTKFDFEQIRREWDFWQAYRDELRRRRGKEPSAESLCPLLHKDLMTHINDTREKPPDGFTVVKNPTSEEMRMITMASVYDQIQGKPPPPVLIDYRQPQTGISLRTFRTRYPRNQQKPIIAKVRRLLSALPSIDEKFSTGITPIRDSKLSENSD